MLPGHLIGATGAGDVKLFAAAGAFIGPAHILTAFHLHRARRRRRSRSWSRSCGAGSRQTVGEHGAADRDGGRERAGDRKPAREQPVRVRAGHRRRHDAGRAGILTLASTRDLTYGSHACVHGVRAGNDGRRRARLRHVQLHAAPAGQEQFDPDPPGRRRGRRTSTSAPSCGARTSASSTGRPTPCPPTRSATPRTSSAAAWCCR